MPVVLPVAVDRLLTYRVPEGQERPPAGTIVVAPLGQRDSLGVVWTGTAPADVAPDRVKPLAGLGSDLLLPEALLAFIDWVARWTLTPRGMVLRMVLRSRRGLQPEPPAMGLVWTGRTPDRETDARRRILALVDDGRVRTKAEIAAGAGASSAVVAKLGEIGVLAPAPLAAPDPSIPGETPRPVALGDEQAEAAAALRARVADEDFSVSLLEGVTGSGKTEVFIEAIAATLAGGRQALVLMPEIALTTVVTERIRTRLGLAPDEWHSGMGDKTRARVWRGAATGAAKVVVGARSALFLPFADLGLIVVDEEHDASFKQEDGVVYNARDMAVVRARIGGIPVVLSSATPSVETRVNAEAGRYRHLHLARRATGAALPEIAAIDLRGADLPSGHFLHDDLVNAADVALGEGRQVLFFLNRRGYAPLTLCRTCGHRFHCPNCSAWLVDHRLRGRLVCHHCGHVEPRPDACPECGGTDTLAPCGPGVERIAEEVAARWPDRRTTVLSSDLPGGPDAVRSQFRAVADGAVDIVIGTQLVAKGYTFPALSLVGVIDADIGLHGTDPRAAERTFQLLTQVTGRAGRLGAATGRGLVQTHDPDHPVMRALVAGDREAFYREEIETRRMARLPPFVRLAGIVVSAPDRDQAIADAAHLARTAPRGGPVEVLGPAEAPLAILRGRHRFRLLVRAPRTIDLQVTLRTWLAAAGPERGGVRRLIDIDPQSFL